MVKRSHEFSVHVFARLISGLKTGIKLTWLFTEHSMKTMVNISQSFSHPMNFPQLHFLQVNCVKVHQAHIPVAFNTIHISV